MYFFSSCQAHPGESLQHHLESVAKGVELLWGNPDGFSAKAAIFSALLHDIGKANYWFQERIRQGITKKDKRSYHSKLSAIMAWHISVGMQCENEEEKNRFRLSLLVSILKHHGNLDYPWTQVLEHLKWETVESDNRKLLQQQFESLDISGISTWLDAALAVYNMPLELPEFSFDALITSLKGARPFRMKNVFSTLENSLDFLHIYGSLLQADKIHAASGKLELPRFTLSATLVDNYRNLKFGQPSTELEQLRNTIYRELEENLTAYSEEKFFTVTAPTGSGKTLASLNAALKLRRLIEKETGCSPRIIYCLPFTSIIDQNFQVYTEALEASHITPTSDLLLKHHHLSDLQYSSQDPELEIDGADLLVETWQSEIVVTTFYQLLYTIFSNRNRELKRFAQLQNAIILMDEVQAVPRKYWDPIRRVFITVGNEMGARFLLLTATKPLLFTDNMSRELIPNHAEYFSKLSRIKLINRTHSDLSLDQFFIKIVEEIKGNPLASRLIVVNQRRLVRELFELAKKQFPEKTIFCLSANITPLDRKKKICEIQQHLKSGLSCLIITTQLIEAGVDLSVDIVDRDIAPLDSIIQAAGRCNRHGKNGMGVVNVWSLVKDKGTAYYKGVYDPLLIGVTKEVLDNYTTVDEGRFHELAQTYFSLMYNSTEETPVDHLLIKGEFAKLKDPKEGFVLIDEVGVMQSYFIIQNDDDRNIWEQFEALQQLNDPFERKRLFHKLRFNFLERIIQIRRYRKPAEERIIPLEASAETYSPNFGFIDCDSEDNETTAIF